MLVYKDYVTFNILGASIDLISCDVNSNNYVVAAMGNRFYYLGDEVPDLAAATYAWLKFTGKSLSAEDKQKIFSDNVDKQ